MYNLPSEILLLCHTPIKRSYYSNLVLYTLAYINTIVHLCIVLSGARPLIINIKLN